MGRALSVWVRCGLASIVLDRVVLGSVALSSARLGRAGLAWAPFGAVVRGGACSSDAAVGCTHAKGRKNYSECLLRPHNRKFLSGLRGKNMRRSLGSLLPSVGTERYDSIACDVMFSGECGSLCMCASHGFFAVHVRARTLSGYSSAPLTARSERVGELGT